MTADIVPFGRKVPKKDVRIRGDLSLAPPSEADLVGFINVLKYLWLQSISGAATVDILGDEMTVCIHQHNEVVDEDGIVSSSALEFMAGCDFTPEDQKLQVQNLLKVFERVDLDNQDDEAN